MFGYNKAELIKQTECCLDSFDQNCFWIYNYYNGHN